jgi:hypothetical protein
LAPETGLTRRNKKTGAFSSRALFPYVRSHELVPVQGGSMSDTGIHDGDVVVCETGTGANARHHRSAGAGQSIESLMGLQLHHKKREFKVTPFCAFTGRALARYTGLAGM